MSNVTALSVKQSKPLKIEYRKVSALAPYENNARTHSESQVSEIAGSIRRFGFVNPVLIGDDGVIIAGHGRIEAARKLGMETVPTVTIAGLSAEQRRALILADNRIAMNSGWDVDLLRSELADLRSMELDTLGLGFTGAELDALFAPEQSATVSAAPSEGVGGPVVTREGDVWLMGDHRLVCGDSSDKTVIDIATGGREPDLLFLDPPYEVEDAWLWGPETDKLIVCTDHKHIREPMTVALRFPHVYHFVWDTVVSWYTTNRPLCRHRSAFVGMHSPDWDADRAIFVDDKPRKKKRMSQGAFEGAYDYEPLPFGSVRLQTVYQESKASDSEAHTKPAAWVHALLAGAKARSVLDIFAGAGTTFTAAPLGVPVWGVELNPARCDTTVFRWSQKTGLDAVHEPTGKPYPEIARERTGGASASR